MQQHIDFSMEILVLGNLMKTPLFMVLDKIRKTFTVMHNPVFLPSDTLSFVLLALVILDINGKQFRCSVFSFVQHIF